MEADTSRKFSPSKLDTYKNCPRRYQYRYVDRIDRRERSAEAFVGTMVHAVLEDLYENLRQGRTTTLEQALEAFERNWNKDWGKDIVIRDQKAGPEDYREIGRACLKAYFETHAPFDQDRTVEVEKRIGFPLDAGGVLYLIEGFIDRLALGKDGAFEIHDYKTSKRLPTQEDVDADWQLAIYDLAVRHSWPDTKRVRLIWHYLRHGKDLISEREQGAREKLRAEVAELILKIKSDHQFEPRQSALCDWCEYRDLCPLFRHAETLAELPASLRKKEEGWRLAEQYGGLELKKKELREEIRRLEREQEGLEPGILRYASEHGVSVVSGATGDLSLSTKPDPKFPTKTSDPDGLAALEGELKAIPVWPEVSKPIPTSCSRALRAKVGRGRFCVEPVIKRYRRWGPKRRFDSTEGGGKKRKTDPLGAPPRRGAPADARPRRRGPGRTLGASTAAWRWVRASRPSSSCPSGAFRAGPRVRSTLSPIPTVDLPDLGRGGLRAVRPFEQSSSSWKYPLLGGASYTPSIAPEPDFVNTPFCP